MKISKLVDTQDMIRLSMKVLKRKLGQHLPLKIW